MSVPPPPPRRRDAPVVVTPTPPLPDPEARAARRAEERNGDRRPWVWIVAGVVVVVLIAGGAALALGGGGGGKSGPTFKASTIVDLKVGTTKVESVGAPVALPTEFPPDIRDKVLKTIDLYVAKGIVAGLRTGKADDAGLAAAFDPGATARLAGPDRAVLVDEGLPKAVGEITVTTPPVPLTALSEVDGKVVLVTAGINLSIKARAEKGTVTISRAGDLVFALQITGDWRITGWTLNVHRSGPGVTPTPTSTTPTTTATS